MENSLMVSDNISTVNGSSVVESFSVQHFALRANSHLKSIVNCMEIHTALQNSVSMDSIRWRREQKRHFHSTRLSPDQPLFRLKWPFALSACVSLNYTVTQG